MKKKKTNNYEKDVTIVLLMIFIIPVIIFIIDATNLGHSFFPYIDNLTNKYDWMSFIGAYCRSYS